MSSEKSSSSEAVQGAAATPDSRPVTKGGQGNFRRFRRADAKVLTGEERSRQGSIVNAARIALQSTDHVKAFLNSHHDQLGGRPLDLATSSDEGWKAVEAAIDEERLNPSIEIEPSDRATTEPVSGAARDD